MGLFLRQVRRARLRRANLRYAAKRHRCLKSFLPLSRLQSQCSVVQLRLMPTRYFMGFTSVDGVSVNIEPDEEDGGYRVDAVFERTAQSTVQVTRLSPSLDLRHEIRNNAGAVIPINKAALERPRFVDLSSRCSNMKRLANNSVPGGTQIYYCAAPLVRRFGRGKYRLTITFCSARKATARH